MPRAESEHGFLGTQYRVYLSDYEVQEICDAATPAIQFASILAAAVDGGVALPALISLGGSLAIWQLKRSNKAHGNRGVCITFTAGNLTVFAPGLSLTSLRIRSPDYSG